MNTTGPKKSGLVSGLAIGLLLAFGIYLAIRANRQAESVGAFNRETDFVQLEREKAKDEIRAVRQAGQQMRASPNVVAERICEIKRCRRAANCYREASLVVDGYYLCRKHCASISPRDEYDDEVHRSQLGLPKDFHKQPPAGPGRVCATKGCWRPAVHPMEEVKTSNGIVVDRLRVVWLCDYHYRYGPPRARDLKPAEP